MLDCLQTHSFSVSSFQNPTSWTEKTHFKSQNKCLSISYFPRRIQASILLQTNIDSFHVKKYIKPIPCSHRLLRALLGLVLVIATLGIALLFKPVRRLFTKTYYSHSVLFPVIVTRASFLKPGSPLPSVKPSLPFTEKNLQKAEESLLLKFNDIFLKKASSDLSFYPSHNIVCSLTAFPGWIFKSNIILPEKTRKRWEFSQKIKKMCQELKFDKLVIPEARLLSITIKEQHPLFKGNTLFFIAEQEIPFNNNSSYQKQLYIQNRQNLNAAISQATKIMCLSNLNDFTWTHCPIIFDRNAQTHSKIALIDIEPRSSMYSGTVGTPSKNWISCIYPYHFNLVKSIFIKYNNKTESFRK